MNLIKKKFSPFGLPPQVGPLAIDWSHPLTQFLSTCTFRSYGGIVNLAFEAKRQEYAVLFTIPFQTGSIVGTIGESPSPFGNCWVFNGNNSNYLDVSPVFVNSSVDGCTMLAIVQNFSTGDQAILTQGWSGLSLKQPALITTSSNAYSFEFSWDDGSAYVPGYARTAAGVSTSGWDIICGSVKPTAGQSYIYVNGVDRTSSRLGPGTTGVFSTPNTWAFVGKDASSSPTLTPFSGQVFGFMTWNRSLTPEELALVSSNPFCFLYSPMDELIGFADSNTYFQTINASLASAQTLRRDAGKLITPSSPGVVTLRRDNAKIILPGSTIAQSVRKAVAQSPIATALASNVVQLRQTNKPVVSTSPSATTNTKAVDKRVNLTSVTTTIAGKLFFQQILTALSTAVTFGAFAVGKVISPVLNGAVDVRKAISRTGPLVTSPTSQVVNKQTTSPIVTSTVSTSVSMLRTAGKIIENALMGAVTFGPRYITFLVNVAATGTVNVTKAVTRRLATAFSATAQTVTKTANKPISTMIVTNPVRPRMLVSALRSYAASTVVTLNKTIPRTFTITTTATQVITRRTNKWIDSALVATTTLRRAVSRTLFWQSPVSVVVNKSIPQRVTIALTGAVSMLRQTSKNVLAPVAVTQTNTRRVNKVVSVVSQAAVSTVKHVARTLLAACSGIVSVIWSGSQTFAVTITSLANTTQTITRTVAKLVSAPASTSTTEAHGRMYFVLVAAPLMAGVTVVKGVSKTLRIALGIVSTVRAWYYDHTKKSDGRVLIVEDRSRAARFPRVKARYSFFSKRNDF